MASSSKKIFTYLEQYLREDKPQSSSRVLSIILCLSGIIFAFFNPENYITFAIFIGTATGKEIGNKFVERRK